MLYSFHESITDQMSRVNELRSSDPTESRLILETGETLVQYAEMGSYRKLCCFTASTNQNHLLYYHIFTAFKICLMKGHLMMADHMIQNGLPIKATSMPQVLIQCLLEASDTTGVNIATFLASKGYDINMQVSGRMS